MSLGHWITAPGCRPEPDKRLLRGGAWSDQPRVLGEPAGTFASTAVATTGTCSARPRWCEVWAIT